MKDYLLDEERVNNFTEVIMNHSEANRNKSGESKA